MPRLLVVVPWPVIPAINGTNIVRTSGSLKELRDDDKILIHVSPGYVQKHMELFAHLKCNSNNVIAVGEPSPELLTMFQQMAIPTCSLQLQINCKHFIQKQIETFLITGSL